MKGKKRKKSPHNDKGRIKIRKRWVINPKSRVKESKKIYSKRRNKKRLKKELEEI